MLQFVPFALTAEYVTQRGQNQRTSLAGTATLDLRVLLRSPQRTSVPLLNTNWDPTHKLGTLPLVILVHTTLLFFGYSGPECIN